MDVARLERLGAACPLEPQTAWFAVDAGVWPRCGADASPDRGYDQHPYRHSHGQPIVAGWNFSWLVQVPLRCSSWTAPLRVRRIIPGETVNVVVAEQIRSWLEQMDPPASTPIFTFDAGYDAVQLSRALAHLPVGLLALQRAGLGCRVSAANDAVRAGIQTVTQQLARRADGTRGLYVDPACCWTIAEYVSYQYPPTLPEEMAGMAGGMAGVGGDGSARAPGEALSELPLKAADHTMDATRYALHSELSGRARTEAYLTQLRE